MLIPRSEATRSKGKSLQEYKETERTQKMPPLEIYMGIRRQLLDWLILVGNFLLANFWLDEHHQASNGDFPYEEEESKLPNLVNWYIHASKSVSLPSLTTEAMLPTVLEPPTDCLCPGARIGLDLICKPT